MAMTYEDGFLQAIREEPEDDTPRLIYADWLEERDDPRGEFIRIQCELARLRPDIGPIDGCDPWIDAWEPWDERQVELKRRQDELVAKYKPTWLSALPVWEGVTWGFHRGVVSAICTTFELFVAHSDELFCLAPVHVVSLNPIRVGRNRSPALIS